MCLVPVVGVTMRPAVGGRLMTERRYAVPPCPRGCSAELWGLDHHGLQLIQKLKPLYNPFLLMHTDAHVCFSQISAFLHLNLPDRLQRPNPQESAMNPDKVSGL